MKVALTVWGDRISPVFDAARTILIAEIQDGEIVDRRNEAFLPEMSCRLAGMLNNLGIDVLICGAISQLPAGIIENSGIKLIPFVVGNVEKVLGSYVNGAQIVPAFSMPGCGWRHGRKKGRAVFINRQKEVMGMPRGDGTGPQGNGAATGKGRSVSNTGKGGGRPGKGRGRGSRQGQGQGTGQGCGNRQ